MDSAKTRDFVESIWDDELIHELVEYIKIPNKSPMFEPDWEELGHMDKAVEMMETWARAQPIPGMRVDVVRLSGRTPLIFIDIPGQGDDCVLLYGHLDKQPEMTGWADHLGPWKPVIEGDRLYGRGGADDGYAIYSSLAAIMALQAQGTPHARCVVLIEACEESGSYDLPYYMDHLAKRMGQPSLVVCLDSGCGNYDQLWLTTSLRGLVGGTLRANVLEEGVHSGDASGIVPSSFRVLRQLLARLEDADSGRVLPPELHADIPEQRMEQARLAAEILGDEVHAKFPLVEDMRPVDLAPAELLLQRAWRPALAVTGAEGLPPLESAGNVMRPGTGLHLSLRLPPTVDAVAAGEVLKQLLETNPPYGAKVTLELDEPGNGWHAPALAPWLERSVDTASKAYFDRPAAYNGEGGSIPFMGMLGERFPDAQFVITGVLGPHSNAHGPNEFLHIPMAKHVTMCVAQILADHHRKDQTESD